MKQITLSAGKAGGQPITTADLIISAVNNPPKEGFDAKAMAKSCRIIGIIESAVKDAEITDQNSMDLQIEDADFDYIVECLKRQRYTIPAQFILDQLKQFGVE